MKIVGIAIGLVLALSGCAQAQEPSAPLVLERTIALPNVAGRIDHMAIDPAGRRLIVAELGNNAVDVVDLARGAPVHRIANLHEPQGLAFDQTGHLIVVAERASGAVRIFDAASFAELASIPLGEDADNVRIDAHSSHAIVGYGDGALAIIDLEAHAVLSRISLPAHPESFQLDAASGQIFVNLPDAHAIGVVDSGRGVLRTSWPQHRLWNFPMALDAAHTRLAIVFRLPAQLELIDTTNGAAVGSASTCGDSDDVFLDARRHLVYVACGAGSVDVFNAEGAALRRAATIRTAPGARTALFVPALDRLFVAARARSGAAGAAILVFRPQPQ